MRLQDVMAEGLSDDLRQAKVIGLDIGSRSAKGVLLYEGDIHTAIVPTGLHMQETADDLIGGLLAGSLVDREEVTYIVGTGYGRVSMEFADIEHQIVTEISCHAMGGHYLNPGTRTIVDIGGQDSKAIKVDPTSGKVVEFVMNDKCAAGTGRFLEKIAQLLDLTIDELGTSALLAEAPSIISSQCVVFAESEVISLLARGERREDIAAGIHYAVARRVRSLLNRIGLESELVFSGGVSKNVGLKQALQELLGFPFTDVAMDMVFAGALGAAVLAHKYSRVRSRPVRAAAGADGCATTARAEAREALAEFGQRVAEEKKSLAAAPSNGTKKVGYLCSYTPLELIEAAGASKVRIFKSGDSDTVASGELLTQSVFCDFTKSIIGAFENGDPLYRVLDKVYAFYTCDSIKMIAEAINERHVPTELFVLPKLRDQEGSRRYFAKELANLRSDLERLTGRMILDSDIDEQIRLHNSLRRQLMRISALRKRPDPPITGRDFHELVKGYYYLPPRELLDLYRVIHEKLEAVPDSGERRTRLLLSGGVMADGDDRLLEIIEDEIGARVVAEEHCTGLRPFYHTVPENGDALKSLADGYLDQAPCSRMKPLEDWIDFNVRLATEYEVDGVVFSYLKFCPCYGLPKTALLGRLQEVGIPVLEIQSDYSASDQGQLKTRLEALIEVLGERTEQTHGDRHDNDERASEPAGLCPVQP